VASWYSCSLFLMNSRHNCGILFQMFNSLRFGRRTRRMSRVSSATATWISSLAVRLFLSSLFYFLNICLPTSESKYSHAAVWPLLSGYDLANGKRSYPLAAMVANLAKPTPDKPALMRHDDVVTFFHEMGHVFHGLLSRTKFARFHGTR